ncbi:MAG: cysteate synthase [Spirochaetes bacterium]|nr:cysteate synthase [Spirochaetota bacterium]
MEYKESHYSLRCTACGAEYGENGNGFLLSCSHNHPPALLRTFYKEKLEIRNDLPGVFRYSNWLPVRRIVNGIECPSVYRSTGLAKAAGLDNLFISFNGYWPERQAFIKTCSFKELETAGVLGRLPENNNGTIVVSSAGNTGRAFLKVCSENAISALIVVPEKALSSLWLPENSAEFFRNRTVKIAALRGNADYFDAIRLGRIISSMDGFFAEGGAKNVGRRDGMGVVVLSAAEAIGVIPDHYFQAVGSGTGGIAAREMSERLLNDGTYGRRIMHLHLSQNEPFTPIKDAWENHNRSLKIYADDSMDDYDVKMRINSMRASVLSNRKPPYSLTGGLYDALMYSSGHMYGVSNEESMEAGKIFYETEGMDLDPAAEVAVASLFQAVKMERVKRKDIILLNITGGGYRCFKKDNEIVYIKPDIVFDLKDIQGNSSAERVGEKIALLYEKVYI